jgi:ketosteroid isomerase-like protein
VRTTALLMAIALLALAGCSESSRHDADMDSLLAAETAFQADIAQNGLRDAFLAHLAERSVVFRPFPVDAVKLYESLEDAPGLLTWEPMFVDASAAGDFGFTVGPWEFRPEGAGTAASAYGHYVSAWIKDENGDWKVAVDAGVPHARQESAATELVRRGYDRVKAPFVPPAEFKLVLDAEEALWTQAQSIGFGPALEASGAPDMKVLRFGLPPLSGAEAASLLAPERLASWEPKGGFVSESGDLGYTFGLAMYPGEGEKPPTGRASYLRIWERLPDGTWQVVVDAANPIPQES